MLSHNRDKELLSDPHHTLVSVNGSQVWIDDKFEDESIDDVRFNESSTNSRGKLTPDREVNPSSDS
ncbi:hypothetical protein [Paenisporosarcina indica]|uniref:hypothetical protein n=1 Tax=Paenisporosarcina indica TaxID=650093 RepID=UPI00094FC83E|nr:hypothetical protein [Paenisporosarcina indica]